MKILVLNAGSSSLKYQLFDMANEEVLCKGTLECIAVAGQKAKLTHEVNDKEFVFTGEISNHTEGFNLVIEKVLDKDCGVLSSISEINAIGHRVLHAGEVFDGSIIVYESELENLKKLIPLGPLHMPANISCIESCKQILPNVQNVAVFDTTFHKTMPDYAYMYGIPYEDYKKLGIRKYGFHGTSHKYVSTKAKEYLNIADSKIITCHLGNGSSISAVLDGKCIDTSMGLTPLEGLLMGTRCGDIDPTALQYLMKDKNMNIEEILNYLNKKSGYLGVSGISSDSRAVTVAADKGDERANLTLNMSAYRIKKYIGSYSASLGGVDAIVFTGGIGENSGDMRKRILKGLEYLGIELDEQLNCQRKEPNVKEINKKDARVKILVIPTNEELVIARETKEQVTNK